MILFDITKTNIAVERLIDTTEDPRHLYLLHAYNRHRYLEMAGRFEEIFAPDMTVENPVYHFNLLGMNTTVEGAEAVKDLYREWTRTGQCVFYIEDDEQIAVSDNMVVSSATLYQQTPGSVLLADGAAVLAADGLPVEPETTYLVKTVEHMVWPYDDHGRLKGEDVWEYSEAFREIIPLDPHEVLSVEQAGRLLDPLIKPLPAVNPFIAELAVR